MCRPLRYPGIGASPRETGDKPSPQQTGAPNHHPLDESSTKLTIVSTLTQTHKTETAGL